MKLYIDDKEMPKSCDDCLINNIFGHKVCFGVNKDACPLQQISEAEIVKWYKERGDLWEQSYYKASQSVRDTSEQYWNLSLEKDKLETEIAELQKKADYYESHNSVEQYEKIQRLEAELEEKSHQFAFECGVVTELKSEVEQTNELLKKSIERSSHFETELAVHKRALELACEKITRTSGGYTIKNIVEHEIRTILTQARKEVEKKDYYDDKQGYEFCDQCGKKKCKCEEVENDEK